MISYVLHLSRCPPPRQTVNLVWLIFEQFYIITTWKSLLGYPNYRKQEMDSDVWKDLGTPSPGLPTQCCSMDLWSHFHLTLFFNLYYWLPCVINQWGKEINTTWHCISVRPYSLYRERSKDVYIIVLQNPVALVLIFSG